jgi:hypothetical protein
MIRPITSLAVVINGPVAKAASIFNLSSIRGMNVPNNDAKTITVSSDVLTVNVIS